MERFWLRDQFADLALDLDSAFRSIGRDDLAESVWQAEIVEPCPCANEACGTFYTLPEHVRTGREKHLFDLQINTMGIISVGIVDDQLASVELLGRPDICKRLIQLFSYGWSDY